ncbi:MAG TPA: LysM peptidoglycan-binding domain-containing protein, partial [Thiothrix sp.]|nr:LysM peptidoglycan-binding domain-containing protein [Thiothrix sp.]
RKMGVKNGYNSWQNIDGGTRYLKYLLRRFNGNKHYAAAAYNGGPGAVSRTKGPRFPQVRKYSRHVMRAYHKMNGVKDVSSKSSRSNKKEKTYRVRKGQTLSTIARITKISVKRLKAINKLSSSHLKIGQKLRLGTIDTSETNKAIKHSKLKIAKATKLVKPSRSRKKSYRVGLNQTLYSIARESGVSVQHLKKLNKLSSSTIKVGQRLRLR